MMIVVSKNQVILPSFIPLMVNSEEYKALKKDEQQHLDEMMKDGRNSIRFTTEEICDDSDESSTFLNINWN